MNEHIARLEDGIAWEIELARHLGEWGWAVAPFGTATLPGVVSLGRLRDGGPPPGELYKALMSYRRADGKPSGLRWLPDIIAGRGDQLCLIDAKSERRPSMNYAVELRALAVGSVIEQQLFTPVYYIWPDAGVLTPSHFTRREVTVKVSRPESFHDRGSGTPFALIPKRFATPAAEIFGNITGG